MSQRDDLFATELERISGFRFDEPVARVFPDMITRSVPGYSAVIAMTGQLAGHYVRPAAQCYDLGCSRGAGTLAMAARLPAGSRVVAVDNSPAMVQYFSEDLERSGWADRVELRCADLLDEKIEQADFVAMNFTLQFINPMHRFALLERICAGINPGGALLLSEKICFEDTQMDNLMNELYYDYKRSQGYSELEISQKRSALENVLIPETRTEHLERLRAAGFASAAVWFQCFNFCSFLAIR